MVILYEQVPQHGVRNVPRLESQLDDRLSMCFFVLSIRMPGRYSKVGHAAPSESILRMHVSQYHHRTECVLLLASIFITLTVIRHWD